MELNVVFAAQDLSCQPTVFFHLRYDFSGPEFGKLVFDVKNHEYPQGGIHLYIWLYQKRVLSTQNSLPEVDDAPLWELMVFDVKNQFGEPPFSLTIV